LNSVETYLTNFQADLGAVSAEIETLQSRSTTLNIKLDNRKVVERLLGPYVEEITIAPTAVRKIVDGSVDDGFVKAITELDERSKALSSRRDEQVNMKAIQDAKPFFADLTNKVISELLR
jgi:vacuolar protein sorting-associated protein 52